VGTQRRLSACPLSMTPLPGSEARRCSGGDRGDGGGGGGGCRAAAVAVGVVVVVVVAMLAAPGGQGLADIACHIILHIWTSLLDSNDIQRAGPGRNPGACLEASLSSHMQPRHNMWQATSARPFQRRRGAGLGRGGRGRGCGRREQRQEELASATGAGYWEKSEG